ncbi:MAG: hypothetical protein K2M64_02525, partial [Clostridia bacterium]|nr:hypothetical protein [Clostridia bacterium]
VLTKEVENLASSGNGKTTYTLPTSVSYEDESGKTVTANVKWTANSGVTVTEGDGNVTITVPNGVASYILTGTLVDAKGKAYEHENNPVMQAVSVNGGTVNPNPTPDPTPSGEKGTQGNPYTVAEALTIINGLQQGGYSATAVYTKGIVSNYSLGNSGQHKCDISDTAGSSSTITVYYADLGSGVSSFQNGDTIVVYGYLMHFYNNKTSTATPEVATNNNVTPMVVSVVNGGSTPTPTPTPDPDPTPTPNPDGSATINLTGNSTVKSSSASENVFQSNGITVTNSKGSASSFGSVQEQYEQRFYANTTVTIAYTSAMTKIVITLDTQGNSKIEDSSGLSLNVSGATVTVVKGANGTVTIEFSQPVTSVTLTLTKQIRAAKIDVYC